MSNIYSLGLDRGLEDRLDWLVENIKRAELAEPLGLTMTEAVLNAEPLMDCQSCRVQAPLVRTQRVSLDSKCCDFNPFVSGFAVGAWLKEGGSSRQFLNWTQELGVLTRFGVAQPAQRDSSQRPRCQFYSKDKEGACAIWSQRPSFCRSYFCAHSSQVLRQAREKQETLLSELEAQLLGQWWFEEQGGELESWQAWVQYMETPYGGELPPSLLFEESRDDDDDDALIHYRKMWDWFRSKGERADFRTSFMLGSAYD